MKIATIFSHQVEIILNKIRNGITDWEAYFPSLESHFTDTQCYGEQVKIKVIP